MLEGRTYVPLLHLRLAEMRALRELPDFVKDKLFPVIRLRPWLGAKALGRALEVIRESFGERRFGLDLDPSRNLPERESPAFVDFRALFDPNDAFARYYELVEQQAFAVPVLRVHGNVVPSLDGQLDHVQHIDRGLIIRDPVDQPLDAPAIIAACAERGLQDRLIILDCGWARDLLSRAAQCTAIAQSIVQQDPDAELVIGGSSFPDDFAKLGSRFELAARERPLFNEVRRNLNAGRIYYGDWASTRPPTDPVPMTNVPRIDVAHTLTWESWRSADGETYQDIAHRAVRDLSLNNPDTWGGYMIAATAGGTEPAIKSPTMAAAVRINLHMMQQANWGEQAPFAIPDEPVGEDL